MEKKQKHAHVSRTGTNHLLVVQADGQPPFTYTDFATGQPGESYAIPVGDGLSWIVKSGGQTIGYRIDFNKNGSPFAAKSVIVPGGGISPPQIVRTATGSGTEYSVTLTDLRMDDPEVRPVDNLLLEISRTVLDLPKEIHLTVTGDSIRVDTTGPFIPGTWVRWICNVDPFEVDFSGSPHSPRKSPFVDPSTDNGPLYETGGKTASELVRSLNSGESPTFPYVVRAGQASQSFNFIIG